MKKTIGLSISLGFLGLSLYSLLILAVSAHLFGHSASLILVTCFILISMGLVCYNFNHTRLLNWNADIVMTILLFITFMLSFTLPNRIFSNTAYLSLFWFLKPMVAHLMQHNIGIYELFLFFALLAVGLTIGEDRYHD